MKSSADFFLICAFVVVVVLALPFKLAAAALEDRPRVVRGKASFYGEGYRGKRMANGARFDPSARTCASFAYELGSVLRVRALRTGRTVNVTVTDRGPAMALGRLLDLSQRAFADIAPLNLGVIEVDVEVLGKGEQ
jgi:rare lipoprotein A